jgi:hypothetical protein
MKFLITIISAVFKKGNALPTASWHYAWYIIVPALLIFLIWLGKKVF